MLVTNKKSAPTILVYRVGQLGDTLVALPAIGTIRKLHPEHQLVLLTDRFANENGYVSSWEILKPTGWFDDAIFYKPSKRLPELFRNFIKLIIKIRKLRPESVFVLAPERNQFSVFRDKIFFKLFGGVKRNYSGAALLHSRKRYDTKLPKLEAEWSRLLRITGQDPSKLEFHLTIPEVAKYEAENIIDQLKCKEMTYFIAIGPGSKMPAKQWAKERYAELGTRLLSNYSNLELLILGGEGDNSIGEYLCRIWGGRAHNLAGNLSIYGSAAMLEKTMLYVGNDTGTMHLAALSGTPCVAIFSARDFPGTWEPYGQAHIILRHDTDCAGCMLQTCIQRDNLCLNLISVDEVYNAIQKSVYIKDLS